MTDVAGIAVTIVGFAITFGTLLYKFGALEGRVIEKLEGQDERIGRLERGVDAAHGRV